MISEVQTLQLATDHEALVLRQMVTMKILLADCFLWQHLAVMRYYISHYAYACMYHFSLRLAYFPHVCNTRC